MRYRNKSLSGGLSSGIFFIGLALSIIIGHGLFLPIFFVTLAFTSLIGSAATLSPRGIYGGIQSFFWMLVLALFFFTGSWVWFLIGLGISAILGALIRPILAAIMGLGIAGLASTMANPQQPAQPYPAYQSYEQPSQETYNSYEAGYHPPAQQPSETYQEGAQQYHYNPLPKYEQPEVQYPQELPPQ